MSQHRRKVQTTADIYRMPLLLAAVSAVGLASALLGDALWDVLSWAALSLPIAVTVWYWRRPAN